MSLERRGTHVRLGSPSPAHWGTGASESPLTARSRPVEGRAFEPALLAASLALNHLGDDRLTVPFAERAGCGRREPGVAVLGRSDDGINASNTINGGLIALAVEEATLSRVPGATLSSLAMRYLRPARVGPVVATAAVHGDLARVDVRDAGSDDRLTVTATTRAFPSRDRRAPALLS